MSRSIAEHEVAKFFHQKFGITLYPYPGDAADLQTPCGLNIEVKVARNIDYGYCFRADQIFKKEFDVAILVRTGKRKRRRYMECALWSLNDIRELILVDPRLHSKKSLSLKPPGDLLWWEMPYPTNFPDLPLAWC